MKSRQKTMKKTALFGETGDARKLRHAATMILARWNIPPHGKLMLPSIPVKGGATNLEATMLWLHEQLDGKEIGDPVIVAALYTDSFCSALKVC